VRFTYRWTHARFLERPNRFLASVEIEGNTAHAHVPNTGRLRELLLPGTEVLLSEHDMARRRTRYTLRLVRQDAHWVCIDSASANDVTEEALREGMIKELEEYPYIRREVPLGGSRFDFLLAGERPCWVEVKGVTLVQDGWAAFPDAPTERGRRHIGELIGRRRAGEDAAVLFIVQNPAGRICRAHYETDPDFAALIRRAARCGVRILAYRLRINEEEMTVALPLPVRIF
jgi:sugar fermentation stimulation protein A